MEDESRLTSSSISNELDRLSNLQKNSGVSYWRARDIMPVLGYERWENFVNAIDRAKTSCSDSGIPVSQQFRDTTKVVGTGSGASMEIEDVFMTRYACYLVAMNGDPKKPEIAAAQTYFAVQTRRQELQDNLTEEQKRVELRERVIDANLKLNHVAKSAGVERFDIFHAEGYKGLYGGRNVGEIKQMKGIDPKDDLLDCCERAELAANEFRITQTEEKLLRDRVRGQPAAANTHHMVGMEVRNTIAKIGGTMPEKLPKAPSIKRLVAKRKRQRKISGAKPKEID
jgi:DNA-damage-inducible protein D